MSALDEVGFYDELLDRMGAEDDDIVVRLRRSGYTSAFVQSSWVFHPASVTRIKLSENSKIVGDNVKRFEKKYGMTIPKFHIKEMNACLARIVDGATKYDPFAEFRKFFGIKAHH